MSFIRKAYLSVRGLSYKVKDLMHSRPLLALCLQGGSVLAVGSGVDSLFRFARNIILARLLAPEAFGLMATIMAAVDTVEAFTEVGLRLSVIQNPRGSEKPFLNVVWWVSFLRGVALYTAVHFLAPFISSFYERPEAVGHLRVGLSVLVFGGLLSPRVHVLEKEMKFAK